MTKRELCDLLHLRISGGKLSNDINVQVVDIRFYFDVAYNYALMLDYYERHNMAVRDYRVFGYSEGKLLGQQLVTLPATIQKDTSRNLNYFVMPADLMVLPGGRGLDSIFGSAESSYVKVDGQDRVIGLDPVGAGFFWYEKYPTENRVYIKGNDQEGCTIYVRMMQSTKSLSLDDEVIMPAGRDSMMLDKMAEWFIGERMTPENIIKDNTDDIHRQPRA